MINQNQEQIARDAIDKQLLASGWIILNLEARLRVGFPLSKILNDCWLFFITKIEQSILYSISNTVNYFTTPLFIFHLLKCVKGKRMFFVDTNDIGEWKILDINIFNKDKFNIESFSTEIGLSKIWMLFWDETDKIINELNKVLAAKKIFL
jgi:hypothetical protein